MSLPGRAWRGLRRLLFRCSHGMLTCAELEAFIDDYLEGRLARHERLVFELHLRMCRPCRSYIEAYRRTLETGRKVWQRRGPAVDDEVPEDLVQAILAARGQGDGTRSG